jgi:hypothetical protein
MDGKRNSCILFEILKKCDPAKREIPHHNLSLLLKLHAIATNPRPISLTLPKANPSRAVDLDIKKSLQQQNMKKG